MESTAGIKRQRESTAGGTKFKREKGKNGVACAACEKAKRKCSGQRPCERCARLGKECVDGSAARRLRTTGKLPTQRSAKPRSRPKPQAAEPQPVSACRPGYESSPQLQGQLASAPPLLAVRPAAAPELLTHGASTPIFAESYDLSIGNEAPAAASLTASDAAGCDTGSADASSTLPASTATDPLLLLDPGSTLELMGARMPDALAEFNAEFGMPRERSFSMGSIAGPSSASAPGSFGTGSPFSALDIVFDDAGGFSPLLDFGCLSPVRGAQLTGAGVRLGAPAPATTAAAPRRSVAELDHNSTCADTALPVHGSRHDVALRALDGLGEKLAGLHVCARASRAGDSSDRCLAESQRCRRQRLRLLQLPQGVLDLAAMQALGFGHHLPLPALAKLLRLQQAAWQRQAVCCSHACAAGPEAAARQALQAALRRDPHLRGLLASAATQTEAAELAADPPQLFEALAIRAHSSQCCVTGLSLPDRAGIVPDGGTARVDLCARHESA